jgi:hypothetical protein
MMLHFSVSYKFFAKAAAVSGALFLIIKSISRQISKGFSLAA